MIWVVWMGEAEREVGEHTLRPHVPLCVDRATAIELKRRLGADAENLHTEAIREPSPLMRRSAWH
jgi:hypothetical protein